MKTPATQPIEQHPLGFFLPENTKLLMLGSFPPPRARWSMNFYYPNIQNDMWRILGLVFYNDKEYFLETKKAFSEEKAKAFCREKGIGIGDTAMEIIRLKNNASDNFLQVVTPLNPVEVLAKIPECEAIVVTGQKAMDNLIATARSNKVAVCLGFQDFSQLMRDYGDKEAKVVMNTVGNIFSGQVVGETAKTLSERFGKVLQKRQSISINRQDVSTSINTQMDALIPPSKISGLTQGMFVGSVSDNFNERIEQKIFHCEIVVDAEKVKREEKAYKPIPIITDFTDEDGKDCMKETVQANYRRIKEEVKQIVQEELERIANDENLKHLLQQK